VSDGPWSGDTDLQRTLIALRLKAASLALSLIIRIYRQCGTIEADELRRLE